MKNIIKQVAEDYNTTPEEIEIEIQKMIEDWWNDMPGDTKEEFNNQIPTMEQIINHFKEQTILSPTSIGS